MRKALRLALFTGGMLAVHLCLPGSVAAAPSNHLHAEPLFADIPWGISEDALKRRMASKGYTPDTERTAADTDHDLWFKGTVQNTDAEIIDFFDGQRHLVKTAVDILTSDDDCKKTFETVVLALIDKYGAPTTKIETVTAPFTFQDRDFVPAIKAQKAEYLDQWLGDGTSTYAVYVRVESNVTVSVNYESQAWAAEYDRRRSKPDTNL